jgi:hypothetical protein
MKKRIKEKNRKIKAVVGRISSSADAIITANM